MAQKIQTMRYFVVENEVETVAKEFVIAGSESDLKGALKYLPFNAEKK